MFYDFEIIL